MKKVLNYGFFCSVFFFLLSTPVLSQRFPPPRPAPQPIYRPPVVRPTTPSGAPVINRPPKFPPRTQSTNPNNRTTAGQPTTSRTTPSRTVTIPPPNSSQISLARTQAKVSLAQLRSTLRARLKSQTALSTGNVRPPKLPTSGGGSGQPPDDGNRAKLIAELQKKGIKHDPKAIVHIDRDVRGRVIFLENGNSKAGLQHILERHGVDFERRGISREQIPKAVIDAVKSGVPVGVQGRKPGRPIYEVDINGTKQRIAVTVGSNGFVVGANPAQ